MRLTERVHVVGSGRLGFGLSHEVDCHVYLVNGNSEMGLVDAGVDLGVDQIIGNIRADGLDLSRLKYFLLIHAYADHAGGCREWKDRLGVRVYASPEASGFLSAGDETGIRLGTL